MTKFIIQKVKVSSGIQLNTWKYNVCGIKLELIVLRLHKIRIEKISLFLLNMYAVPNFLLLPVNVFDLFSEVYHNCILYTSQSR